MERLLQRRGWFLGLLLVPLVCAGEDPGRLLVRITLSGALARGALLRVYDLSGRLVADLTAGVKSGRAIWNASGFASGVYLLVAEKGALSMKKKVIYSK